MRKIYGALFLIFTLVVKTSTSFAQIGAIDASFAPTGSGVSAQVNTVVVQPDGKVLIGGSFTSYNGTLRNRIARLNVDGTLDLTFDPLQGFNGDVYCIALQSNGNIIVGGNFTTYDGQSAEHIARLKPSGTRDFTFYEPINGGLNSAVHALVVMSDDKIFVGGSFTSLESSPIPQIIRVDADGGLDNSFSASALSSLGVVNAIAVQSDGKVIIGGEFTSIASNVAKRIARLKANGGYDVTFVTGSGCDAPVNAIVIQPGDKIVVGGSFSDYDGIPTQKICRLNTTGVLESAFTAGISFDNDINTMALQPNGQVVVGGKFQLVNSTVSRNRIARINGEGSLDMTFNPGTGFTNEVKSISLMAADGRVVVGGAFSSFNGTNRKFVARLLNHSITIQSTIPSAPWCAGSTVQFIYSITGTYNASNTFHAVLSDATGSFAIPVSIGTMPGTSGGSINATIPVATAVGTGYAVRIGSTDPPSVSEDPLAVFTGLQITTTVPSVSIVANPSGSVCATTSVTYTATVVNGGTPSYVWYRNGVAIGTNSSTYVDNMHAEGDEIYCEATSTATCASPAMVTSNSIFMTVTATDVPSVSISATPNGSVCAGTAIAFSASALSAGTVSYQWSVNDINIGTNLPNYSNAALLDGDQVKCSVTSTAPCPSPTPVNSNTITVDVIPIEIPSISITASPAGQVCDGTDITFTANYGSAGNFPSFQWTVNGNPTGTNSDIYTDATLSSDDVVQCTVVSNAACPDPTSEISNSIVIDELPIVVPSINISSDVGTTICDGTAVTFTATATNEGSSPVYTWFLNTVALVQSGSTYVTSSLLDGDVIECGITNNDACAVPSSVISNNIAMTVIPVEVPIVGISSDAGTPLCEGTNVTFTASVDNAGASPSYQWEVDGSIVGTNSDTYADATLVNDAVVTCTITSNAPCPSTPSATSNSVTMAFDATETLAVSISSSPSGPVCIGTNITFTADASSALVTPTYEWTVNGNAVGSDSPIYSDATLVNDDVVQCTVTSTAACPSVISAISNDITIVITATEVPSITISSDAVGQVCDGATITFTADAISSGVSPTYAWELNTVPIGSNLATFASALLANGDVISCTVTSNSACANPTFAISNSLTVDIAPNITPTVFVLSDLGTTICQNADVTFSAVVANEGAAPTYAWLVDGVDVGVATDTYATNTLTADASVECILTNTDACAVPASITSDALAMTVVAIPAAPISIIGSTVVCEDGAESYDVADVAGATSYTWTLPAGWSGTSTSNAINASIGTTGGVITVTANNGCGNSPQQTLNVAVNPNFSTYSGTVTINGDAVTSGWVFVLKQLVDGVEGWEKVDSAAIANDGSYLFAELPIYGVPFILKAVANNSAFPTCVPSYYAEEGSNYQWDNDALTYALISDCGGVHVKDIAMVTTSGVLDGICSISGTVIDVTGGKMAAEDPIPGVDVVVEKVPPGNAFTYGPTDALGRYRFEDMPVLPLPTDRYRIYVSVPGIPMFDTYSIDVNPSDTAFTQLDFYLDLDDNLIYINNPNGVAEGLTVIDEMKLLPNPMHDRMTVILPANFGVAVGYRVLGIDGKVVAEHIVNGNSALIVDRGTLPNGIYFLEVTNTQGLRRAAKVVVQ